MKGLRHYILSAALFALFLALPAAASASGHSTCDHSGWTALTSDMSSITSSGNYYLAEDVALEETLSIKGTQDATLCLNGNRLTLSDGVLSSVIILERGTLNLYDCTGSEATGYSGTITGGSGTSVIIGTSSHIVGGGIYAKSGILNMYGGAISNNNAGDGGGIYISATTFNMYGGTISNNNATQGGGVDVYEISAYFNMYGGTISGNTGSANGGGVYLSRSTFNLRDGIIRENKACYGGGVHNSLGTFNMYGGEIYQNENLSFGVGGGVYSSGDFNMYDGRIQNNTANLEHGDGGGVKLHGHVFAMYGGTISGNQAKYGGGVSIYHANRPTFKLCGGSITENTATGAGGGVYYDNYDSYATMHVSGAPTIQNNTVNGLPDNLYLSAGKTLTVGTDLDGDGSTEYLTGGSIGVSTQTLPAPGAPVDVTGGNSANYKSFFTSDKSEYLVVNRGAGNSQTVQLSCEDITDFPLLEPSWCYANAPILTFTNYEALQGATFKLYSRNADGTYTYEAAMTEAMAFPYAGAFRLREESLPENLPAALSVTATLSGKLESAHADFELRDDAAEGKTIYVGRVKLAAGEYTSDGTSKQSVASSGQLPESGYAYFHLGGSSGKAPTLELNGFHYSGEGSPFQTTSTAAIRYASSGTLQLVLQGESSVAQNGGENLETRYGVYTVGSIAFSGGGSLSAAGARAAVASKQGSVESSAPTYILRPLRSRVGSNGDLGGTVLDEDGNAAAEAYIAAVTEARGDVDRSGHIALDDTVLCARIAVDAVSAAGVYGADANAYSYTYFLADVNQDGDVNVHDVIILCNMLVGRNSV